MLRLKENISNETVISTPVVFVQMDKNKTAVKYSTLLLYFLILWWSVYSKKTLF